MKNTIAFTVLAFMSFSLFAQISEAKKATFFINVYINQDNDIRLEKDIVAFENVRNEVEKLVSSKMTNNKNIVYRIYADNSVDENYIDSVEQKMLNGKPNAEIMRFLLDKGSIDINGPNWFQKLEAVKLEKVKG